MLFPDIWYYTTAGVFLQETAGRQFALLTIFWKFGRIYLILGGKMKTKLFFGLCLVIGLIMAFTGCATTAVSQDKNVSQSLNVSQAVNQPELDQGGNTSQLSPYGTSGSTSGSSSSSSGFKVTVPIHFGMYLQGLQMNTFSVGFPLQLGLGFNFGDVISLEILGEIAAGGGYPCLLEYNYGGMAELYFRKKAIGIGVGYGRQNMYFPGWFSYVDDIFGIGINDDSDGDESSENIWNWNPISSDYIRVALIFGSNGKFSIYGQRYTSGDWGFGLQLMF